MNIYRESMTKVLLRALTVRIWREEAGSLGPGGYRELQSEVRRLHDVFQNSSKLTEAILKLPGVNAVEIIDEYGNGEVLYRCDEVMIGDKRLTII